MYKLYLYINKCIETKIDCLSDYYIPIEVKINSHTLPSSDIFYFRYKHSHNLLELALGIQFGEIDNITVVDVSSFRFYNSVFASDQYLKFLSGFHFMASNLENLVNPLSCITIDSPFTIDVFENAVRINVKESSAGRYLFYSKEKLSVITDISMEVVGFLITNLTVDVIANLKEYAKGKGLSYMMQQYISTQDDFLPIKAESWLLRDILNLTSIDLWKFLAYGVGISIIDGVFLIEIASEYILKNTDSELAVELAFCQVRDQNKAKDILRRKITFDSLSFDEKRIYNDLWLYLSAKNEVIKKKLI